MFAIKCKTCYNEFAKGWYVSHSTPKIKTGRRHSRFFNWADCDLQISVQPLANIVRHYTCRNRYDKG